MGRIAGVAVIIVMAPIMGAHWWSNISPNHHLRRVAGDRTLSHDTCAGRAQRGGVAAFLRWRA